MSTCDRCGAVFSCGMADGAEDGPCWCTQLPSLPRTAYVAGDEQGAARCFCPRCLREMIALQQNTPPEER